MDRILPVPIAKHAVLSVVKGFDTVLRLGWVPALLGSLAGLALESSMMTVAPETGELEVHLGPMLVFLLVAVVTQAIFSVAWHRYIGLGESWSGRRLYLRFGRRELIYGLVAFVVVSILSMGLGAVPVVFNLLASGQALGGLFVLGAPVMALFLIARMCLMLPMVALGGKADPARSWQAVIGNTRRVITVLLLVGLPVLGVELLLISVFGSVAASGAEALGAIGIAISLIARFVSSLVFLGLLALIVSALTIIHVVLNGDEASRAHLPAPAETFVETT